MKANKIANIFKIDGKDSPMLLNDRFFDGGFTSFSFAGSDFFPAACGDEDVVNKMIPFLLLHPSHKIYTNAKSSKSSID